MYAQIRKHKNLLEFFRLHLQSFLWYTEMRTDPIHIPHRKFFFPFTFHAYFRWFDFIIIVKSQIDFSSRLFRIMFVIVWSLMCENVGGCELSPNVYALALNEFRTIASHILYMFTNSFLTFLPIYSYRYICQDRMEERREKKTMLCWNVKIFASNVCVRAVRECVHMTGRCM